MSTALLEAEETVDLWRSLDLEDGPAGPLYTSGQWARYELTAPSYENTICSSCSASRGSYCC